MFYIHKNSRDSTELKIWCQQAATHNLRICMKTLTMVKLSAMAVDATPARQWSSLRRASEDAPEGRYCSWMRKLFETSIDHLEQTW